MTDYAQELRRQFWRNCPGCGKRCEDCPEDLFEQAVKGIVAELDAANLRAGINGLGITPTEAGGPGHELAYWQRRKLDAAIRHLRDLEDYFRLRGDETYADSPNMRRADRARGIYEQISDDYLNGRSSAPTMRERAETAEAAVERYEKYLTRGQFVDELEARAEAAEVEVERLREALGKLAGTPYSERFGNVAYIVGSALAGGES